MALQSLIHLLYPPQCVMCEDLSESDFALCGPCWAKTPFIEGLCCDVCGAPLRGESSPDEKILCDDCMVTARPWRQGRSALIYKDKARRFILSIKHGDRTDLVRAAGPWLVRAAAPILTPQTLLIPIPLHRLRLLKRRFNQAAMITQQVGKISGLESLVDGLVRPQKTAPLEGHTRDQRFEAMDRAISANPKRLAQIEGRKILLIDDVMTSGATFAAATEACFAAGASDVCVLALARVVKDA